MDRERIIAKFIEHSDRLINTATKLGVAYVGYKANNHWSGALTGLVALRLAESNNLAAGIAGTATLAVIGLTSIPKNSDIPIDPKTGQPYLLTFAGWQPDGSWRW